MTLPADIRARLDAHLDAVERSLLAAGYARQRRRGVVDDLETQIQDMLSAKTPTPSLADLEAVLARLDPPSAYGEGGNRGATPPAPAAQAPAVPASQPRPPAASVRPRFSRTAIWGLVCILLSMLPLPLLLVSAFFFAVHMPSPVVSTHPPHIAGGPELPQQPIVEQPFQQPHAVWGDTFGLSLCFIVLMGPLAIAGTILGWIALGQIRRSAGMIRGTGLALFDGLFFPLLFLIFSVITPFFLPILGLLLLAACIAVIVLAVRMATGRRVPG